VSGAGATGKRALRISNRIGIDHVQSEDRVKVRTYKLRNGNLPGDPSKSPRCGAKTRSGAPCRAPAMKSKFGGYSRCRMHGGASTGPRTPEGLERSRRANWKHGLYSAEAIAGQREFRDSLAIVNSQLNELALEVRLLVHQRKRRQKLPPPIPKIIAWSPGQPWPTEPDPAASFRAEALTLAGRIEEQLHVIQGLITRARNEGFVNRVAAFTDARTRCLTVQARLYGLL